MNAYDLIDKKVRITATYSMHYDKEGTVLAVSINGSGEFSLKVRFSGHEWDYSYIPLTDLEEIPDKKTDGCECGSSAVGSPRHSYYCPLYKEWE